MLYYTENICDALRDLVPFVQFTKREKHPWKSVNFSKKLKRLQPATLLKLTLLHGCFSRFLNCTNGTKSRNASNIVIPYLRSPIWVNLSYVLSSSLQFEASFSQKSFIEINHFVESYFLSPICFQCTPSLPTENIRKAMESILQAKNSLFLLLEEGNLL